jgi:ACS family hexuronate transporter-like MFS transporter
MVASRPVNGAPRRQGFIVVGALVLGYIGIYLCRKNFAVANPMLQEAFHATKGEVGRIATVSTLAYAAGKLVLGPVIDRIGGRWGFLLSLLTVAGFGAIGAFSPGLGMLGLLYSANRFVGAGGFPAMMKLAPTWFEGRYMARVTAVLSLGYVLGGIAALMLAREIVAWGGDWRWVMGGPSIVLLAITVVSALVVWPGPLAAAEKTTADPDDRKGSLVELLTRPQFLIVLALSFTLTLMRETFNTWSVDFLTTVQEGGKSVTAAALSSTGFDLAGAVSILVMGAAYDACPPHRRGLLIFAILVVLAGVLLVLPGAGATSAAFLIAAVGLLVYGPYSLLAGVMAVESGGHKRAATASSFIDAVGYVAGALAGEVMGRLLDRGGYPLGFRLLAGVTAVAAMLALALGRAKREEAV